MPSNTHTTTRGSNENYYTKKFMHLTLKRKTSCPPSYSTP